MIRVGFIPKRADNGSINLSAQAILSARKELYAAGVDLAVDHEKDVDILCVHKVHLQGERSHLLEADTPLIIDEDRDSARVSPIVRKWANAGFCCGILKPHLYRPRWIYTEGIQFDTRLLELGPGYGCFGRLDCLKENEPDWNAERPIDVHWAGWMDYPPEHVKRHREQCADAVEALADHGFNVRCVRGRHMNTVDYWNELRQSKICVSPYGWAETCHRDVEAILCGCTVVKPPTPHIETFPNVYIAGEMWPCDESFVGLAADADAIIRMWDSARLSREHSFRWIVENSTNTIVASRMAGVFQRCIERANA